MIEHLKEYLLLKPGGRLFLMNGGCSKEPVEQDVTEFVTRVLSLQCRVAPGTTLRDFLLLLKATKTSLDFFDRIIGQHCREFVEEGLSQTVSVDPDAVFEFYWHADDSMGIVEGLEFPSCHELVGQNRDSARALSFVPLYEVASLPVILNHKVNLFLWGEAPRSEDCKTHTFLMGFTLYQLIYGLFWELSFFSHPSNREQRADEIFGSDQEGNNEATKS